MDYENIVRPSGWKPLTEIERYDHLLLVATLKDVASILNRSQILQERDIPLHNFNIDLLDLIDLYKSIEDAIAWDYEDEPINPLIPDKNPLIIQLIEADWSELTTREYDANKLFVILFTDFMHYKEISPRDERVIEACEKALVICQKYM